MATFKPTSKAGKTTGAKKSTFTPTKYAGYNQSTLYGWQRQNQSALDLINQYNARVNNGEWLSVEDRAKYKSAVDTYTSSGTALRNASKHYGTTYTDEEEKSWLDSLSSLNEGYTGVDKFYNQFKDDREYGLWKADADKRTEFEGLKNNNDYDYYVNIGKNSEANNIWNDIKKVADANHYSIGEFISDIKDGDWEALGGRALEQIISKFFPNSNIVNPVEVGSAFLDIRDFAKKWTTDKATMEEYLTPQEMDNYYYLMGKGDYEKANDYAKYYSNIARKEKGEAQAPNINNNIKELATAFKSGLDSFSTGFDQTLSVLGSVLYDKDVNVYNPTTSQYAYSKAREDNTGLWMMATDAAQSIGNQVPNYALAFATGGASEFIPMAISAGGNSYAEMINEGYGEGSAIAKGVVTGALEALLGKWLGGLPGLGSSGGVFKGLQQKFLPQMSNTVARFLINNGVNMADEALEEGLQELLDPVVKWAVTLGEAELEKVNWEEVGYSALLGGLTAGVLEGVPSAIGTANTSIKTQQAFGNQAPSIVAETLAVDPTNKIALNAQNKLANNKTVSGGNLNEMLTTTDRARVKDAITNQLTEYGETSDISALAEALTKQTMGEELSNKESKLIEASKYGNRIANELNPENIKSGQYTSKWAESIGTRRLNADVYSRRPSTKVKTKDGTNNTITNVRSVADGVATVELADGKVAKVGLDKGITSDVVFNDPKAENLFRIATDRVGKVDGWTTETANAMIKGYDGTTSDVDYRKAYTMAFDMGKEGVETSQVVSLANKSGVKGATLLGAYDMGRQATEKTLTNTAQSGKIESEVKTDESTGIYLRNGGEWNGSANPEGQVSILEESTGRDTSREDAGRKAADSEAVKLVNEGQKVRVADLGILNGSKTQTVTVVDKSQETAEMTKAREKAEARGVKARFFLGDNLVIEENGELISARAYIKGDYVFVRADHPLYTADQLMSHEMGHDMVAKGEVDINKVRERLAETVGKENIDLVADMYELAYRGSNLSADEIWEECICDSLGNMNVFSGKAEIDQGIMTMVLTDIKKATEDTKTAPNKTRGAPDGKASSERETMENNRFARLRNFRDDLPNVWFAYSYYYFYVYTNYSFTDYRIIKKIKLDDKNKQLIDAIERRLSDDVNSDAGTFDRWVKSFQSKKRSNNRNIANASRGRSTNGIDGVDVKPRGGNTQPNTSTSNGDSKLKGKTSRELNAEDEYSQIFAKREEVGKLNQAIQEFEMSDDFKSQMDKFNQAIVEDNADKGIAEYLKWQQDSGYGQMMERRDALMKEIGNLQEAFAKEQKNNALAQEKTAIEKSGLSEADYFRKQAVKQFGHTPYFYDAGYIIPNGKMLNFSGEKGQHYGTRGQDHRAIGIIYADTQGTAAMTRFMNDGNIRIMAETPGVDISSKIAPTKEQYSTIRSFIYDSANREYFSIDFSDENGRVVGSLQYENRINPTRIINDIKHYYETGEIREQSNVDKYRFSRELDTNYLNAVNRGDMETVQRMVDEAAKNSGYNYHLYHGTDADFTKFDLRKHGGKNGKGEGYGIYLAANEEISAPYGKNVIDSYTRFNRLAEGREKTLSYNEVKKLVKRLCELEAKQMVEDEGYDSLAEALKDTWISNVVYTYDYSDIERAYGDVANKLWKENNNDGDLINEMMALSGANYDYNNALRFYETVLTPTTGIDGFHYIWGNKDGSGEQNDIYLAFNSEQIKSADPITYDDNGNVIPLSQRFNPENNDIRYSRDLETEGDVAIEATPVSNRSLLANALLDTVQSDIEYKKLDDYKAVIGYLEAEEVKLADLKRKIYEATFGDGDKSKLKELREEARKTEARIDLHDKKLLQLESTTALKNVLERAKKQAYSKALEKGREAMHRNVEGRYKTIVRHKTVKVAKELANLLEKGNKKRNIKNGAQDIVRAALDLSNMYFESDDNIIMNGIVAEATDAENLALAKYRSLYEQLHATDDDVTNHKEERKALREQMNEAKKELLSLLERERNRISKSKARDSMLALATAYGELKNADEDYLRLAYKQEVQERLTSLAGELGDTLIADMSLKQLEALYDAFSMVKHLVTDSNKLFRDGKKEDLAKRVSGVFEDLSTLTNRLNGDYPEWFGKALNRINEFGWNNLRPVDVFELIGSSNLEDLYWDAIKAQDVYARDVEEYKAALIKARRENNYKSWDLSKTQTFKTADGELKLTLAEMMSIYAYSHREQADEHLRVGGIQFAKEATYKNDKGAMTMRGKEAHTYRVGDGVRLDIINALTKEQRAYVDTIQALLTTWGEKGNEVSRILYGIDLFKDENYFPLRSSKDFLSSVDTEMGKTITTASLSGSGFTKSVVPHANNPIILEAFDDVVNNHIDKMSKYHAYVIPIENLRKILDAQTKDSSDLTRSVKQIISSKLGDGAKRYLEQYITDLNGGIKTGYNNGLMGLFGKAKGAQVAANLSVWVQQYFSVIRAMAEVNAKYFIPFMGESYRNPDMKLYDEMKKYAPITTIKEMGGFDVGSNRGVAEYVGYEESKATRGKIDKKMQDAFGVGAALMDKLGWITIWKAVKKEVAATNKYKVGSDEFYKACGERFERVIAKTQVYDSVNARSGNMRNKSDWWKMATSFMGEPTAIAGMAEVAIVNYNRAKTSAEKKAAGARLAATISTITISTALTSIAKSLVYAMRDDDEDEDYLEKYASALAGAFKDDLNILNYIPIARDIVSILEGFTVERPDMALIEDLINAVKKVVDTDEDETTEQKVNEAINLAGSFSNLIGVPLKNIIRDIAGLYNLVESLGRGYKTDFGGEFKENWFLGKERTKSENIYNAVIRGDTKRSDYYKSTYKDEDAYNSALRKAIRDNDPRLEEAALARLNGDRDTYYRLMMDVIDEGNFDKQIIKDAFDAEYNYQKRKAEENK